MSNSIEDEIVSIVDSVDGWVKGITQELGESPEAMRGAMVLASGLIALCDAVRDSTPKHLAIQTQLVGVVAVIAGVMENIQELHP